MEVCVFGAGGMLGHDVLRVLGADRAVGFDRAACDVTDAAAVAAALDRAQPRVAVNCAAFTNVDACETARDAAFAVNDAGAEHVAAACAARNVRLIHMSTDYVFDGTATAPLTEEALTNPQGVYGASKLAGELAVQAQHPGALIVRTAWLFGAHGPNFIETILRLAAERDRLTIVDDQQGAPTYTYDLAHALGTLVDADMAGYMHLTNSGACTWYELARFILECAGIGGVTVAPISTAEFGRPAPRPAYSVLDCSRYAAAAGAPLRPWRDAVRCYLDERAETRRVSAS